MFILLNDKMVIAKGSSRRAWLDHQTNFVNNKCQTWLT